MNIVINKNEWAGDAYDCEACGFNQDNGVDWSVNDVKVWSESRVGCYGGSTTEDPLLSCILDALLPLAVENNWFKYHGEKVVPEEEFSEINANLKKLELSEEDKLIDVLTILLIDRFYIEITFTKTFSNEETETSDEE